MEKVSDLSQLVKKAQKDPQAFAQLYAQTFSFSYAVAKRYLNNPQDIEDVLQTSYMYAANSLSSLHDPEKFNSWMQTIILHECQKCLHTNKKISDLILRSKETVVLEDEQSAWTDFVEQNETYDAIRKIVDGLPNEQKMCAALFYYEERSIEEIAVLLEVPQGTVKSRLFHVRKKVEKALRKLSKEDSALFGVTPFPILRSYFKHGEREVAASTLRESVWSAILSPGSVSRGAGHFLRFGAAASGSGGFAASSGTAMTTMIKAAAVAVSAVAVVGGSVTVREHIRSAPLSTIETTTTTQFYESDDMLLQPAMTETTRANTPIGTRQDTTAETRVQQTQTRESTMFMHNDATRVSDRITTRDAAQTAAQQTASAVHKTEASPHTSTTAVNTATTARSTTTTAQPTTAFSTTTTRSTVDPTTTATTAATTTDASAYDISGGVLRGYSGSESDVSIPSTIDGQAVTAIGSGAFASNQTLRSVQIPSTVAQIGQQAFSDCTSLQSISLPSSLSSIGIGAFDGCSSLSAVSIPRGTESIGDDAFYGCTSLRSITIPSSVQSIGDSAFGGCDGLTIRCAEDSAAHRYAEAHGISYQLAGGI